MLINKLNNSSNSVFELHSFIQKNSVEIYDFFIIESYYEVTKYRRNIEDFIILKYKVFKMLDYKNIKNQSFIICMLNVSERLGLHCPFEQLNALAINKNITLTDKLEAASLFLINITDISDYTNRIDGVLKLLSNSYINGESDLSEVRVTLLHFYLEVYKNFADHNRNAVEVFSDKIIDKLIVEEYNYLSKLDILNLLQAEFSNYQTGYDQIISVLDSYLEISKVFNKESSYLIESNTKYAKELEKINPTCLDIHQLAVENYTSIKNHNIFTSLERGVGILTNEDQLLAYIFSYGRMHFEKLDSAFEGLNKYIIKNIEIMDWGCGQGLATIRLLEKIRSESIEVNVSNIYLIEPSERALKRAALHTTKFRKDIPIITINSDLDSIEENDFVTDRSNLKVHLFSNILDIDHFSMSDLINRIESSFSGLNLFICVSPYISVYKTQRIDDFVEAFSTLKGFNYIKEITEKSGEWNNKKWSRVIRVFEVYIP